MANLIALGGRAVDENLAVVTNATAYFYLVGSTTPLVVYSDGTLTTALGSSVAGDAEGVFPQCWTSLSKVKIDVRDASGVSLPGFPQDNFPTFPEGGQTADQITTSPVTGNAGTDAQTFMANNTARLNTRDNGASLVTSSGTGGAYAVTAQFTISGYSTLQEYEFIANHAAVGSTDTLNVDGQGAIGLRKYDGTGAKVALAANDIEQGDVVRVKYDGTHFVLVNPVLATESEKGIVEAATTAEMTAGTAGKYPDAEKVQEFVQNRRFTSAPQTITSAGLLTIAHGLGVVPGLIRCRLICTSAEHGYAVDDVVYVDLTASSAGTGRVNSVYADTTNIYVRFSDIANCFLTANKTNGSAIALTNASWTLVVEAAV